MFDVKPTFLLNGSYGVITVAVLAVAAIVIAVGIKKALKSGKIKMKIFGGEIDVDNASDQSRPAQVTISRLQLSAIVIKVTEIVTKITEIKIRTTLYDQMLYAEQKFIILHDMLSRQYAHLLSEKIKKENDATGHDDYLFFNNLLTLTLNNSKETVKELLKHNHLESYSEQEFQKYTTDRADIIIAESIQFMWSMYPAARMNITFLEFDTMLNEKRPYLRDVIIDIFDEALKISREKRDEIDTLKKELDNFNSNI